MRPLDQFLEHLRTSLAEGCFVKLTLSQPTEAGLRNLYARVVELREGTRLSLVWHYATRDVTKNFTFEEGALQICEALERTFERARLFTTAGDWEFQRDEGGEGKLKRCRPTFLTTPSAAHDRSKAQALTESAAPFLRALGVTNSAGKPRPGMAGKLRQIQRFAEILGHLIDDSALRERRDLSVVDMGAGKGYLTFAASELLRGRGIAAEVLGVEAREDLVEFTNRAASECGFERVRFVRGAIGDFSPPASFDLLIALHACNTATDDALFQGIRAGASLIIVAPCCHQELRPQIEPPPLLRDVLRHGILLEREAEILTDAIRALLLEIAGYEASVFEFISPEHTGRNLMIAAQKRQSPVDPAPLRERLRDLLAFYGIREQRLARLLGEL